MCLKEYVGKMFLININNKHTSFKGIATICKKRHHANWQNNFGSRFLIFMRTRELTSGPKSKPLQN